MESCSDNCTAKKTKTTNETSIINLNDDCFFEIFKHIPCIREKLRMRAVCKRFDEAVVNYFLSQPIRITDLKHLFYGKEIGPISNLSVELSLDSLLSSCPRLVALDTFMLSRRIWWDLDKVTELPSLVDLTLYASNPALSNENLKELLKMCTNLNHLTLVDFNRGPNFRVDCLPKSISKIHFRNLPSKNHRIGEITSYLSSTLTHISLTGSDGSRSGLEFRVILESSLISEIIQKCTKLVSIQIDFAYESILPFVELKNFEEIVINSKSGRVFSHQFNEEQYLQIIINNPRLVKLHLPVRSADFFDFLKNTFIGCQFIQDVFTTVPHLSYDQENISKLIKQWQMIRGQYTEKNNTRDISQAADSLIRASLSNFN